MRRTLLVVWLWAPVAMWLGVIALSSGNMGARAHSDIWVWRVVYEWLPSLLGMEPSTAAPSFLPWWVRKVAHVAEYAVLGLVVARALQISGRSGRVAGSLGPFRPVGMRRLPAAVFLGWPVCVGVAILDELHQSTLPSRTGSPRDVAVDAAGAALGVLIGWLALKNNQ